MKNTFKAAGMALGLAMAVAAVGTVTTGCESTGYRSTTPVYADDGTITAKIQQRLRHDKVVKGSDVDVNTYRGVVQLSGFVDFREQRARAEELAENVDGVKEVVNDVMVRTHPRREGLAPVVEPAGAYQTNTAPVPESETVTNR